MSMAWLRLWHDMPTDPKFRTIAKVSGQRLGDVIAIYIHLLVDASCNAMKRGVTQCNAENIASAIDIETDQVEAVFLAMQGRVLDGNLLTGWDKRQPAREDNSSERVRKYREKQTLEQKLKSPQQNVTQCNAQKRNVTQRNAPDKDTEKTRLKKQEQELIAPSEKKTESKNQPSEQDCAEPEKDPAHAPEAETGMDQICSRFPLALNTGKPRVITDAELDGLAATYPAANVLAEIRKMHGWCNANPSKRKTKTGIMRFVHSWLAKAQDAPSTQQAKKLNGSSSYADYKETKRRVDARIDQFARGDFSGIEADTDHGGAVWGAMGSEDGHPGESGDYFDGVGFRVG